VRKSCAHECDGCHRRWSKKVRDGPQLRDVTWLKIADPNHPHETLCSNCMFQRASDLGVNLTFDDLELSPFNLFGSPSWFDYFGGSEIVSAPAVEPT
jgi:hypothetical protein